MDALVIGPPDGLAGAVADRMRRHGATVLQALPADAADRERAAWLLEEAGHPPPRRGRRDRAVPVLDALLGLAPASCCSWPSCATAAVGAKPAGRAWMPREADGLVVVPLGRSGRRWHQLGAGRAEPLGGERAAAHVLSAAGAGAASSR